MQTLKVIKNTSVEVKERTGRTVQSQQNEDLAQLERDYVESCRVQGIIFSEAPAGVVVDTREPFTPVEVDLHNELQAEFNTISDLLKSEESELVDITDKDLDAYATLELQKELNVDIEIYNMFKSNIK